ncbi:MAG TPA: universal stress protein [Methylocystis sp.]|nr:universal stress protein [Methylocystis sp.]
MFKKILVPIDTAETAIAEPAVCFAAQLAALSNAAVRLIHVLAPLPSYLHGLVPADFRARRESAALATLQELAKKAGIPMDYFSTTVRTGAVADEVLLEADYWGAHLIVMGAHNPSVRTYLLGSSAEKILHHANCSVMVMRPHKDEQGNYWLFPPIAS